MRLLKLDFSGIGPFAKSHSIDFTSFESDGLYLLRGDTGAGKSTIIDAITFALYGCVAGGMDSSKDRLRSNYAGPHDDSRVRLRFEVDEGIFEVERTPEYHKEGRKTPVPASALLTRLIVDEDANPLEAEPYLQRISEVNAAIENLVGVDFNQFLQTVVLPQGKFAQFIQAKSDERKAILSAIFATAQYEAFQTRLLEQWKQTEAQLSQILAQVSFITDTVGPQASRAANNGDWQEALAATQRRLADDEARWRNANYRRHSKSADVLELTSLLAQSRIITDFQQRDRELQVREDKLHLQQERIETVRQQLDQSLAATVIQRSHAQLQRCEAAVESFQQAKERLQADLASLGNPVDVAQVDAYWDTVQAQLQSVADARHSRDEAERLERELADLETQIARHRAEVDKAGDLSEKINQQLPTMTAQVEQLRQGAKPLPEMENQCAQVRQALDTVTQADTLRQQLVALAEDIKPAAQRKYEALTKTQVLTQQWLGSSASAIAAHLVEGQPCPVCGSCDHPQPRQTQAEEVSLEQVEAAQATLTAASTELDALERRQRDLTTTIAELNQQVGGQDKATLELQLESLQAAVQRAEQCQAQARTIEELISQYRVRQLELTQTSAEHLANLRAAEQKQELITERHQQLLSQVSAHLDGFDTIEERAEHLQQVKELLRELRGCGDELANAESALAHAQAQLEESLTASIFSHLEQALEAVLESQQQRQYTAEVANYERELAGVQALRTELDALDLYGRVAADTDALNALLRAAKSALNECVEQVAEAGKDRERSAQLLADLEQALSSYERKCADSESLRVLAQAARGAALEGGRRISLDTWVLLNQFDDVITAANPHLQQFSAGRYQLKRAVADAGSKTQYAGLGLAVIDEEADGERTPSSLSGGEKFYTSLALALGLVEVISSYAGGVQLRSMIIDEGFGSLDYSRLDDVMAGLQAMQTSGRTVGVVSHVAEMRNRIHTGVEVRRLGSGKGSTLVVYGDDA